MPDLTLQTPLDHDWKSITTALNLTDGATYVLDVVGLDTQARVFTADTDNNAAPTAAITGHPWDPIEDPAREYTPASGTNTWIRVNPGAAILVASEV